MGHWIAGHPSQNRATHVVEEKIIPLGLLWPFYWVGGGPDPSIEPGCEPVSVSQRGCSRRRMARPQMTGDKLAELQSAVYDALMNDNSNQSRFHIAPGHIFCASAGSQAV